GPNIPTIECSVFRKRSGIPHWDNQKVSRKLYRKAPEMNDSRRHDPAYADDPPYTPAGTPDADLLARWLAAALAPHPAVLSALAQRAISEYEAAPTGSALEATLGLLSDVLHAQLEAAGDGPEGTPEGGQE